MSTSATRPAHDLDPSFRQAVESFLGRTLQEDENVTVIAAPQPVRQVTSDKPRDEALRRLFERIDKTAAKVKGVPDEEIEAAIDEAVDWVRHHPE